MYLKKVVWALDKTWHVGNLDSLGSKLLCRPFHCDGFKSPSPARGTHRKECGPVAVFRPGVPRKIWLLILKPTWS